MSGSSQVVFVFSADNLDRKSSKEEVEAFRAELCYRMKRPAGTRFASLLGGTVCGRQPSN